MLSDFSGSKVYLACGYTDLHRGIDGLATIVEQQFKLDPCSDALFLFCGRRTDRIKALYCCPQNLQGFADKGKVDSDQELHVAVQNKQMQRDADHSL